MRSLLLEGAVVLGVWGVAAIASGCASGGDGLMGYDAGGATGSDGATSHPSGDSSVSSDSGVDATPQDASVVGDSGPETGDDEGGNPETSVFDAPPDASGGAGPDATVEAAAEASVDAVADVGQIGADAPVDAVADVGQVIADASVDVSDGGACMTSSVTDYCTALPSMPADPVIDGVLDCGPALVAMTPEGWNGAGGLPAGNSASIAVAWRPGGLYVFVEVVTPVVIPADTGSPPFYGSGAEIYADSTAPTSATYPDPGAIQLVAAAPASSTPAVIGEGYRDAVDQGPWAPAEFGTYPTSTGFVLEAFVVAGDLGLASWTLASGDPIGLDIAVNVSYPDASTMGAQGHRAGQYFLHVGSSPIGAPYADPRAFCAPTPQ